MKQALQGCYIRPAEVAPRAGAWIETEPDGYRRRVIPVAPRAGAWIETCIAISLFLVGVKSLPVRERGLKRKDRVTWQGCPNVAPRAGAWIETL